MLFILRSTNVHSLLSGQASYLSAFAPSRPHRQPSQLVFFNINGRNREGAMCLLSCTSMFFFFGITVVLPAHPQSRALG